MRRPAGFPNPVPLPLALNSFSIWLVLLRKGTRGSFLFPGRFLSCGELDLPVVHPPHLTSRGKTRQDRFLLTLVFGPFRSCDTIVFVDGTKALVWFRFSSFIWALLRSPGICRQHDRKNALWWLIL